MALRLPFFNIETTRMSELHSESNNTNLSLTVRIKLVDLNHAGHNSKTPSKRTAGEHASRERVGAIPALTADRASRSHPSETRSPKIEDQSHVEICMLTGHRIPVADFETHIETCTICANRVELQLDFMEALETAVYQRRAEPESQKVCGAMLISAPELNFAVCGEVEIG
jgi:hypothetical protein